MDMTQEEIIHAVDEAIKAAVRAAKAAIDAGACQTDNDFAKARELKAEAEDARDAAERAIRTVTTPAYKAGDLTQREYDTRGDRAAKGTESLDFGERQEVLRMRFDKAAANFRTNPSAGNWGLLVDAMCAYQRRQ